MLLKNYKNHVNVNSTTLRICKSPECDAVPGAEQAEAQILRLEIFGWASHESRRASRESRGAMHFGPEIEPANPAHMSQF